MKSPDQPALFELPRDTSEISPVSGVEEFQLPDGKIIQVEWSSGSSGGKKTYKVGSRLLHSRNAVLKTFSEFLDLIIAANEPAKPQPSKPRVRNVSHSNGSDEVTPEPSQEDFYKPCEYDGPFSNCPAGVDAMRELTHLAKRLFAHSFAIAKFHKVSEVKLNWVETAAALGATPRGIGKAARMLKRASLWWFKSTQGSPLGATIRFPKHQAIPIKSSEQCSEVASPKVRNSVPKTSEQCSQSSEQCSASNIKRKEESDVVENRRRALVELATTATNELDLIEKLKPHFPEHNLDREFKRYLSKCKERNLGISRETFVGWMLKAHRPLKRAKRRVYVLKNVETQQPNQDVDPEALAQFEEARERYKLEKLAKVRHTPALP